MRWLLGQFFEFVFFELCSNYYSVYNNYLGCLDFRYLKSFISYMQFSRYMFDCFISHQEVESFQLSDHW